VSPLACHAIPQPPLQGSNFRCSQTRHLAAPASPAGGLRAGSGTIAAPRLNRTALTTHGRHHFATNQYSSGRVRPSPLRGSNSRCSQTRHCAAPASPAGGLRAGFGTIAAPRLWIATGALFQGKCREEIHSAGGAVVDSPAWSPPAARQAWPNAGLGTIAAPRLCMATGPLSQGKCREEIHSAGGAVVDSPAWSPPAARQAWRNAELGTIAAPRLWIATGPLFPGKCPEEIQSAGGAVVDSPAWSPPAARQAWRNAGNAVGRIQSPGGTIVLRAFIASAGPITPRAQSASKLQSRQKAAFASRYNLCSVIGA
jgi:hypothetical protein